MWLLKMIENHEIKVCNKPRNPQGPIKDLGRRGSSLPLGDFALKKKQFRGQKQGLIRTSATVTCS
jgi:hypothetical protein